MGKHLCKRKNKDISKGSQLIDLKNSELGLETARLSFRFLGKAKKYGLYQIAKKLDQNESKQFFEMLENFIADFYDTDDIEKFIASHGSKNKSKIKKSDNRAVKDIIKHFEKQYPDVKMFHDNGGEIESLTHLHLKKGGSGPAVVFVQTYESTLYLLALDFRHEFTK